MKDQSTKELEFRFRFFSGLILCIFAVLLMRLWYLQIIQGNERLRMSRMNQSREIKIPAPRGVIYDRDGRVLASSRISHMISVAPDDVLKNQRVIQTLARLLQMKQEDLVTLIKDKRKNSVNPSDYVAILTDVDPKTVGGSSKPNWTCPACRLMITRALLSPGSGPPICLAISGRSTRKS